MSVDFDVPESWPEEQPERGPASRPEDTPEPTAAAAAAPPVAAVPVPAAAAAPPVAAVPIPAAAAAPAWSLAQRIAFRFVFCYLLLYNLPFPLYLLYFLPIPGLGAVFTAYFKFWDTVVLWTGAHVLHLAHPVQNLRGKTGSGDTTYDYVQLLCFAAFAALATLLWTLAAPRGKAREHRRLHEWLRIYVRYALGTILLGYGMSKVIKTQFPFPSQDRLLSPSAKRLPWACCGPSWASRLPTPSSPARWRCWAACCCSSGAPRLSVRW
jgi:hypothetical protein